MELGESVSADHTRSSKFCAMFTGGIDADDSEVRLLGDQPETKTQVMSNREIERENLAQAKLTCAMMEGKRVLRIIKDMSQSRSERLLEAKQPCVQLQCVTKNGPAQ
jgi:hypothetical protein